MDLEYVPLLATMRELHDLPRGMERFTTYIRTIFPYDEEADQLLPLVSMNPMGKEHVAGLLDTLLAMDADGIGAEVSAGVAERLDTPGCFKVGLVVVDDLKGGWTNRVATDFRFRFGGRARRRDPSVRPPWMKDFWISGALWTSEEPTERSVREALLTAIHREAWLRAWGHADTLRDMLRQEGCVMRNAGCSGPALDPEDLEYTREVIAPFLDTTDDRTAMECLFGDEPCRSLGFTPRGLSPRAGLALALHDARAPG